MLKPNLFFLAAGILPAAAIPAFPGAEGYGANANGGRGGDVYHVTTLNPTGTGSFTEAISTVPAAGRTIVFDVSGYIRLPSGSDGTRLTSSKVTIAGQTAPGDGIGFSNNFLRLSGDDLVLRHLRFRRGKTEGGGDCIDLDSGCNTAVLDHLSLMWSTDENMSSFSSAPDNLTFQYSLNAWGLESHSCGGLWDQARCTTHHTLWAHNHTRNPKARPGMLEWINNVTFDWDIGFIMGDSQSNQNWNSNLINNYFICPPGNIRPKAMTSGYVADNGKPNFTIHLSGNLTDNDGDGALNGVDKGYTIAEGTAYAPGTTGLTPGTKGYYQAPSPIAGSAVGVVTDSPLVAYKKIVSQGGALRLDANYSGPIRDEPDTRLINNLITRTPNHITRPSNLGIANDGFGTLASTPAPVDTDRDGMPDSFEDALGWNKLVQDHNTALASSGGIITGTTFFPTSTPAGYTRLEEYLHYKAIPHGSVAKYLATDPATTLVVDLRKYTSGFANSPAFTVSSITGGSVVLSGTGNAIATFTPTVNTSGRARFNFTVTDAEGSTWTQTFAILVSSTALPRDLEWKGAGNAWDTTTATNWLRPSNNTTVTYSDPDRVVFDDSGLTQSNVAITGTLSPTTIDVNAAGNYTLGGTGSVNGTGTLTKRGAGTLTLGTSQTYNAGGTIEEGVVNIADGGSLGGGKFSLYDGVTLANIQAAANTASITAPLEIPAGNTATLKSGTRSSWSGALTGSGTLDYIVQSSISRADLKGNASAFAGNVNFTGNGGVRVFFNNGFGGFNNARVTLGDTVSIQPQTNSAGSTFNIASLSGSSTAANLGGGVGGGAVTYVIGSAGGDTSFAGSITGNALFTKSGTGTLTLGGTSSYTGATTVSAGDLRVTGDLGTTAVTVASGARLSGSGTMGGAVSISSGGTISPGNATGTAGNMNVGSLSLNTAKLIFDLSGNPAGNNDHIQLAAGGALGVTGAQTFQINMVDGLLNAGTYKLVETTGTLTASSAALNLSLQTGSGARQTFALQRNASGTAPGYIQLVVTGTPASLVWTGTGGTWDTTSNVWSNGGGTDKFYNFDAVTFDNTASSGSVLLSGTVQPRSITVNNTTARNYTFSGPGRIGGIASLTKSGNGTLSIGMDAPLTAASTNAVNSATVTVADATGVAIGMLVEGNGVPAETIVSAISGTTLTLSNAVTAANTAVNFTYSWKNTFSGGTTIGTGSIIQLTNDNANMFGLGSGPVTLNGGTLSMYDNQSGFSSSTMNLIVPAGQTGTLNADSRHDLHGTLTGSGTLNFRVPWIRTNLFADWSAFTGTLNVTTDADGGELRMATNYSYPGFPQARVNLADRVSAYYIGTLNQGAGTTIQIGELSGGPLSKLMGGTTGGRNFTYRIGGKTTAGNEVIFPGTIQEQNTGTTTSYVKTGAGTWTLSGTGSWNGGTTVEQGTLKLTGSFTSAAATQVATSATLKLEGGTLITETTNIDSGASFYGYGTLDSDFAQNGTLDGRGYVTTTPGTLAVQGSAFFGSSSLTRLRGGSTSDLIAVTGDLALGGTVQVNLAPGTTFGRYPLLTYGGSLSGSAALTGIPAGTTAHLSTTVTGQVALVIDDSDEDSLPDSWEQTNFGSLTQTADSDSDNDGTSNLAEYRLGLNPSSGTSSFKSTVSPSGRTITWPSANGIVFTVKRSLSLEGTWQTIGTVTGGAGTTASFTDATSFGNAFYKVEFTP